MAVKEWSQKVLADWEGHSDYFFRHLYEGWMERKKYPSVKEAADIMKFLSVFMMGYRRMGCDDLAEMYNRRISIFVAKLSAIGYEKGWEAIDRWTRYRAPLDKIIMAGNYSLGVK